MPQPELPDTRDTRALGLPAWKFRFYERALPVVGALVPWIFIRVAWRDSPGLLWIPVLNLIVTYAGIYLMIRRWRGRTRRLYPAIAGVAASWVICIELLRVLK
ncbi:hypothetical protein ACIRPT_18745 [Streptomyces sp. NPDC101227]|uniref:hypothetical protein n=1 Tax=Streptomyces sp. NPDC101227 TaxID=3366136 RepID=UPI0037F840E5